MHRYPKHGDHLIGLAGYARSGKDTVTNILVEGGYGGFPVRRIAFADPMRDIVRLFRGDGYRERDESGYREDMQTIGAFARHQWGFDFWINLAARRYRTLRASVPGVTVVVSDLRYENELEWVAREGGQVWWVDRPGRGKVNEHESELFLESLRSAADRTILNHGTLEELRNAVRYRDRWTAGGLQSYPLSRDDGFTSGS